MSGGGRGVQADPAESSVSGLFLVRKGECAHMWAPALPGRLRVRAVKSEEEQESKENVQRGIVPWASVCSYLPSVDSVVTSAS